jgi:hypothetical protein
MQAPSRFLDSTAGARPRRLAIARHQVKGKYRTSPSSPSQPISASDGRSVEEATTTAELRRIEDEETQR